MEKTKRNAHLAIFIANLFFGLNIPISRSLMPDVIDPIALTYIRMLSGLALFWGSAFFVKTEKVPVKDLVLFFFAAFFALSVNQLSFYIGLSATSPIDASIVVTMLPIVSMLLAGLILKEPVTLKKAFGVLVGASGAIFLILSEGHSKLGSGNFSGNMIVFLAVTSFALYLTMFKNLISRYSSFTIMRWMFLFASIQSFPFCYNAISNVPFATLTGFEWLRITYIVFGATFIAYVLLAAGQRVLLPTTLSMYNYIQPIMASLVAIFVGLDTFGWKHFVSTALVFTGVYIVTQSKTRAQLELEKQNKDSLK
jgi:drug/metabolite transporter (DMT)-like permease